MKNSNLLIIEAAVGCAACLIFWLSPFCELSFFALALSSAVAFVSLVKIQKGGK